MYLIPGKTSLDTGFHGTVQCHNIMYTFSPGNWDTYFFLLTYLDIAPTLTISSRLLGWASSMCATCHWVIVLWSSFIDWCLPRCNRYIFFFCLLVCQHPIFLAAYLTISRAFIKCVRDMIVFLSGKTYNNDI